MEFRETLLAAQRNQQQKSSENLYYKARFDPPKKEQKQKDKLSANIQKFLAKKEEEERQKKLDALKKRDELLAMRDPKAIRKIQKTLKVIKSANKSVLEDAVDRENTAVTREGPDQPDQDDYGYESQEAAALYEKMMQKYSKIPDEPKFPVGSTSSKKDLNGTRERVKQALQHEDDPIPHKRRRKKDSGDKELSPSPQLEPEKRKDEKPEKPKIRKLAPPPMDFNQLLKLAEQKKSEPVDVAAKKQELKVSEPEPERLMTKRQKREYEEEMARRQRRQERLDSEKGRKVQKEEKPVEKKTVSGGLGRIPKIGEKSLNINRNDSPKVSEKEKYEKDRAEKLHRDKEKIRPDRERVERDRFEKERDRERFEREKERFEKEQEKERFDREREKERFNREREKERFESEREKGRVKEKIDREREKERFDRDKANRIRAEKERIDKERLEKLKAERERIERDIDRLNRDRDRLEKEKLKLDSLKNEKSSKPIDRSKIISKEQRTEQGVKKSIDLKSQNTYRIDKNSNEKRYDSKNIPGKPVPKQNELQKNGIKDKALLVKQKALLDDRSPKLNGHNKPENSKTIPKRSDDKKSAPIVNKAQVVPNKPKISSTFDFDKHVNSLSKKPANDIRKKPTGDDRRGQKRRVVQSDSEYDSEMDDFIDDGEEDMDYSRHIKEIFGYDKSKYRDMDDDDDPEMESSFARQQREEYISKKIGIMEDLEDMRMEAMEKKKSKKKRRISDD